jgi:hypothetical protein
MKDFWDDSDYFTGPPLTDEMVRAAETSLGYKLPESYLRLIRIRNGGTPRRSCFPTQRPTSWAEDHIEISGIRGIGGQWGIDSEELGSRYMIDEWGYPDVGIVIGETPSAGHDTIMLDYRACGPQGEPRVIHVDTECDEPCILVLAPDFELFVRGLVDCSRYNEADG